MWKMQWLSALQIVQIVDDIKNNTSAYDVSALMKVVINDADVRIENNDLDSL